MKSLAYIFAFICIQLLMLSGCSPQRSTERFDFGTETILIDGSSGSVKVFFTTAKGAKIELADTGATQRFGWSVSKVGADRLRLATNDVGSYDIFKERTDWLVLPTGTFLSPSKAYAVTLRGEGANVRANIGESSPPYTDLWISEKVLIAGVVADKLTVKWTSIDIAQVQDATGKVVATLRAQDPSKPTIQQPPKP